MYRNDTRNQQQTKLKILNNQISDITIEQTTDNNYLVKQQQNKLFSINFLNFILIN